VEASLLGEMKCKCLTVEGTGLPMLAGKELREASYDVCEVLLNSIHSMCLTVPLLG
jgi:hypothetical protein